MSPTNERRWVRTDEAAKYLGTTVANLACIRCTDPRRYPFHRVPGGRTILYDLNELEKLIKAGRVS